MENLKHTAGKWFVGFGNGLTGKNIAPTVYLDSKKDVKYIPIGCKDQAICLIAACENLTQEDESNAKLIAAAPELLEALNDLIKVHLALLKETEPELSKIDPNFSNMYTLNKAREIIKKATE